MEHELKLMHLLKLWNSFPSAANLDDSKSEAAIGEWIELVGRFPVSVIADACLALKKRNIAFLPSAGQLFSECENVAAAYERNKNIARRLPPPEYSEEHRESMKKRFNALVAELTSGVNFNPKYGETPRGQKPERKIVERTVPVSFMDAWEAKNGRAYPNKAAVEALLTDPRSKFYNRDFRGFK